MHFGIYEMSLSRFCRQFISLHKHIFFCVYYISSVIDWLKWCNDWVLVMCRGVYLLAPVFQTFVYPLVFSVSATELYVLIYKQWTEPPSSLQIKTMKVAAVRENCCKQAQILVYLTHACIFYSLPPFIYFLIHTHPFYSGTFSLEWYQFHLLMHHICFKIHKNCTQLHSYLPCLGAIGILGVDCWHCLTGIKRYTVSLTAGAFEGDHVSFDFNWLRLNEVICWFYVTCLECPLCNSCMRCVDCNLRRKLTTYSHHCTWLGGMVLETGMVQLEEVWSDWGVFVGPLGVYM